MATISVIIPAYNEQQNIPQTIAAIPAARLRAAGYDVEILVVDNASTDGTGRLAREHGARVLVQPVRGYGNAYRAGFANCVGDVIATGDADLTYPFEILPEAVHRLETDRLDFLTTDRLARLDPQSMTRSHIWGNHALSFVTRRLFAVPFRDSQSGMWIFRRHLLDRMRLRSGGMAFSQELKVEAYRSGFRCAEIPIAYYPRGGETKNRTVIDGIGNLSQLIAARMRNGRRAPAHASPGRPLLAATVSATGATAHADRHARD
ncbi:glycosyltransferase involved in cell wall biosynthesis [Catenuloplanes nepalensis]|uniref:Glycosyltransferase involved in cell wall biosynthesis n=1 Tax=Catenuloplanes nepalensis TaxID=587533 RepID=A0ABT9MRL4_9ACTN|nr:glycosyltransferase family 2 protein [Catenuloplanes nepalensis]MDP9794075.1 glycosyltransferase involved in cell wall biosynthesis [Catenuloplanes nepalensis]